MWDPGFSYVESRRARIDGYHRALCIRSVRYRGTDEVPGLVFGLDHGGSCTGVSYRIATDQQQEVADYLQEREMLNNVYKPTLRSIALDNGSRVSAITFIVRRQHPSYINDLTIDQTARIVANASGQRGANLDYVLSTINSLKSIGIKDEILHVIGQLAVSQTQVASKTYQ